MADSARISRDGKAGARAAGSSVGEVTIVPAGKGVAGEESASCSDVSSELLAGGSVLPLSLSAAHENGMEVALPRRSTLVNKALNDMNDSPDNYTQRVEFLIVRLNLHEKECCITA